MLLEKQVAILKNGCVSIVWVCVTGESNSWTWAISVFWEVYDGITGLGEMVYILS